MNVKPMLKSFAAVVSLAVCSGAGAAEWNQAGGEKDEAMVLKPDRDRGIAVYEVCSACHLLEGWGLTDGTFPQLAGQHREVLIKQLADIRALNRDNPTMYPFALDDQILQAAGYHEGDIKPAQLVADVTDYISKLPMNPDNGKGQWNKLFPEFAQGKKLYDDNCVQCMVILVRGMLKSSTRKFTVSTSPICCDSSSGFVTASAATPTRTWSSRSRRSVTRIWRW